MTVLLDDFARFVANVEASSLYLKWKNDNRGEDALWAAMRVAILTGAPLPAWPRMMTRFGQALIDVARLYVDAIPAAPPPTPAPTGWFDWEMASLPNDSNSAAMIQAFLGYALKSRPTLTASVGVATSAPGDPTVTITANDFYGPLELRRPTSARPGMSSDHHLSVDHPDLGRFTDLWGASPTTGNVTHASASDNEPHGTVTTGYGATAAHTPLRAGLIWPDEFKTHDLSHAVAFAMPNVGGGSTRYPAFAYPAKYPGNGLLLGTLLAWPADVVFDATMDSFSLYFCRRVQRKGMFCRDISDYQFTVYGADIGGGGNAQPWIDAGVPVQLFNGAEAGTHIPGLFLDAKVPWSKLVVKQPPSPR